MSSISLLERSSPMSPRYVCRESMAIRLMELSRVESLVYITHYQYSLQVAEGWCEGTNKNGERGMFPDNFVQMRPATEDTYSSAPKQQQQQAEETTPLSTPPSTPSTPKPASPTVVTRATGIQYPLNSSFSYTYNCNVVPNKGHTGFCPILIRSTFIRHFPAILKLQNVLSSI